LAARLLWLAVSLTATGLMVMTIVMNVLGWSRFSLNDCADAACRADAVQLRFFGSAAAVGWYYGAGQAVEMGPWVFVGWLIAWRKSREPFGLLFSGMLILMGIFVSDGIVQSAVAYHYPALNPLINGLSFLANALRVLFYRFPDSRFVPRWLRIVAVGWVILMLGAHYGGDTAVNFNQWPYPLALLMRAAVPALVQAFPTDNLPVTDLP
jgi:hypothetical protein